MCIIHTIGKSTKATKWQRNSLFYQRRKEPDLHHFKKNFTQMKNSFYFKQTLQRPQDLQNVLIIALWN